MGQGGARRQSQDRVSGRKQYRRRSSGSDNQQVAHKSRKSEYRTMIKAAVVGLGWWGQTILRQLSNSTIVRPVLCVDLLDSARAAASALGFATSPDFDDALAHPDVQAVILCTPQQLHADQIVAAARSGRHVFCEKPLCTTAADAERAIAAVRKAGVQLGIGHERRFEPAVIEMRQRFAAGEFGNPLLLEGNFSQDKFLKLPADNWRLSNTANPVGPLSATGIHMVDLSISLLGRPTSVWARLARLGSDFANGDTLSITIGFASGATALSGRRACDAVHGSSCAARLEGLDGNPRPQPSGKFDRMGCHHRASRRNTRDRFLCAAPGGARQPRGLWPRGTRPDGLPGRAR